MVKTSAVDDATLFDALTNKSFENNSSSNDISSRLCSTSFCDQVAISSDIVSELDARIIQGYRMLTVLASQRGFSIQDVPADGDCLFSAISLQLESVGIQPAESKELRHELVKYMEQNPTINEDLYYRDFLSELQSNENILNADTDVPNDEDNQISLIEDPHTQAEIRWIKYLQRLREGAWGDHLAVQVLASMLNVNIKIISTLNPDMPLVKPLNCTSICNIYLGLIDQFHYVALVKKSSMNAENNKHDISNTEDKVLEEKERAEDEAAKRTLLAMIRQLDIPTWFLTLSAADMRWPDVIQCIAKQYGTNLTEEDIRSMTYQEKSKWLSSNPVTAARHFHYRLNAFFQNVLKCSANPLGKVVDYAIRIEFQARGSPHAHTLIWIEGAPKYGIDSDQIICDFIEKYITCEIPDDEDFKEMVILLQQHSHSAYCRKHGSCRFNFPKPPSPCTLLASEPDSNSSENIKMAKNILMKVYECLEKDSTLPLDVILNSANTSMDSYIKALKNSSKGTNHDLMKAWQANMDIQFIIDAYACVMYVASYMMKNERGMCELLKQVGRESRSEDITKQLKQLGSAFLHNREVSAQEAAYRLLSIPMKQLSRSKRKNQCFKTSGRFENDE